MITKDSIEAAYCFFHQKWRVYAHSSNPIQKDEIEYAVGSYADGMNRELYLKIAEGKEHFLQTHTTFRGDLTTAVDTLEAMISGSTV